MEAKEYAPKRWDLPYRNPTGIYGLPDDAFD